MDRLEELMAQIDAEGRAEEEARAELQRQRRRTRRVKMTADNADLYRENYRENPVT